MRVLIATEPEAPDRINEDWATATPDMLVVLDGATARTSTGCVHGVSWYTNKLGAAIVAEAADHACTLADALANAIREVAMLHPECDLGHPGTPSAAVGILRARGEFLDTLVLADVTIALRHTSGHISVTTDDRADRTAPDERRRALAMPIGDPLRDDVLRAMKRTMQTVRNRPGGYFVAAADPAAAEQALTSSVPAADIEAAAVLTDGAARIVTPFGLMSWAQVFTTLDRHGPGLLLRILRNAESEDPAALKWPRTKASDDATAAYTLLPISLLSGGEASQ